MIKLSEYKCVFDSIMFELIEILKSKHTPGTVRNITQLVNALCFASVEVGKEIIQFENQVYYSSFTD